jgi:hypothetical protein
MSGFQILALPFCLCLALATAATAEISFAGGDGSSAANAILIVNANDETDGVASEYDWIAKHRPDAVFLQQKLLQNNGKAFDIMVLQSNGATEEIYFDITDFFGDF